MFERYVLDCTFRIGVGLQKRCAGILDAGHPAPASALEQCHSDRIELDHVAVVDEVWSVRELFVFLEPLLDAPALVLTRSFDVK